MMLAMAYVLVLAIVALEIPLAMSLRQRLDTEVRQQAENGAGLVAVLAGSAIRHDNPAALEQIAEQSADELRGRIVIVDDVGDVLADSARGEAVGTNMAARPEIAVGLSGREAQLTRESQSLGRELLATVAPIRHDGGTLGAVRVTQDVADISEAFNRTLAGLLFVGLAVLAAGLIVAVVIARQITRPLKRFERTARAVADGDLQARAPVEGSSEQQDLARTFNEMTDRLAGSLEAQSRFVADASHQLRTPLTGLRLRLEEARAKGSDDAVNEQIDRGIDEADRLARTVEELLVLSQTGERDARAEPIDLTELLRGAEQRWAPIAEAGGHRLTADGAGADLVQASRGDLDRVLDALIENAIAYSPPGGGVELSLAGDRISVRDHGEGIGDEHAEALFERFRRGAAGTARGGGTGLGLAIARELARRWKAEVTIENAEGGGALATIDFSPGGERR
jgi:signal transduction histidine kinase